MVATNSITGDVIQTKVSTDAYRDNFDLIFRKSKDNVFDELSKTYTPDLDISSVLDIDMISS